MNILSSTPWLTTFSSSTSVPIYNNGQLGVGAVRFNPSQQALEIYDGSQWIRWNPSATIDLTPAASQTIDWAYKKMLQEQKIQGLMEKHPGLRDLHEKYEIMLALVQQEESSGP